MAAYYYRPQMPVFLRQQSQPAVLTPQHQHQHQQQHQQHQHQPKHQQPDVTHLLQEISDQVADKVAEKMRIHAAAVAATAAAAATSTTQQHQPLQQQLQPQPQPQQWPSASPYHVSYYPASVQQVPAPAVYSSSGSNGCQQQQHQLQQHGYYAHGYYPPQPMLLQQQQHNPHQYQQHQHMILHHQQLDQSQHQQQQHQLHFSTSYSTPVCNTGYDDIGPDSPTAESAADAAAATVAESSQHLRQRHPTDPSLREQQHQHQQPTQQQQHQHQQQTQQQLDSYLPANATPTADDSGVCGDESTALMETGANATASPQSIEAAMADCCIAPDEAVAQQHQHQHQHQHQQQQPPPLLQQPTVAAVVSTSAAATVPCWQYQQQPAAGDYPRFAMYRVQSQRQASLWQQHQQQQYHQQHQLHQQQQHQHQHQQQQQQYHQQHHQYMYPQYQQAPVPVNRFHPVMYSNTTASATAVYVPVPSGPYCPMKAWGSMPSLAVASASPAAVPQHHQQQHLGQHQA